MTDHKWDEAARSDWMLPHLHEWLLANPEKAHAMDRKLRLFSVACCRQRWHLFSESEYRDSVDAAERFADGLAERYELARLHAEIMVFEYEDATANAVGNLCLKLTSAAGMPSAVAAVMELGTASGWDDFSAVTAAQAPLLRCLFGNPFRPATLDPSWRTTTALDLARGIYEERAFDRLPILADALQEAGCANEDMLAHCRGPGPHARGCWVVDLVLGKT